MMKSIVVILLIAAACGVLQPHQPQSLIASGCLVGAYVLVMHHIEGRIKREVERRHQDAMDYARTQASLSVAFTRDYTDIHYEPKQRRP